MTAMATEQDSATASAFLLGHLRAGTLPPDRGALAEALAADWVNDPTVPQDVRDERLRMLTRDFVSINFTQLLRRMMQGGSPGGRPGAAPPRGGKPTGPTNGANDSLAVLLGTTVYVPALGGSVTWGQLTPDNLDDLADTYAKLSASYALNESKARTVASAMRASGAADLNALRGAGYDMSDVEALISRTR